MKAESSFIKKNIGWLIFSIVLVIIENIVVVNTVGENDLVINYGLFLVLSIFIHIPVIFLLCMIGKAIRNAVHPDIVFTDGFWGLLKERIFWKVGPQSIAAIIAVIFAANVTMSLCYDKETTEVAQQEAREEAATKAISAAENAEKQLLSEIQNIPSSIREQSSREAFIKKHTNGNDVVEVDVGPDGQRVRTMIRRGNHFLKLTGTMTRQILSELLYGFGDDDVDGLYLDLTELKNLNEAIGEVRLFYIEPMLNTNAIERSKVHTLLLNDDAVSLYEILRIFPNVVNFRIPSETTIIRGSVFNGCQIEEIEIPASVTTIAEKAFSNCRGLKNIYFAPDSRLTTIGKEAFGSCTELARLDFPPSLVTIGEEAFDRCYNLIIVNIPDSVKVIGDNAFAYCENLRAINISESSNLEVFGKTNANKNLHELYFPKTIKEIGYISPVRKITIAATNPPKVEHINVPEEKGVIFVPAESLKLYEEAWFDYSFTFDGQLTAIP